MRADTRRLLIVLVAGLLVSGAGAVMVERSTSSPAAAEDNPIVDVPVSSTVASAPVASSSSTVASGPVTPPRDPYAEEPIIEIGTIEIPKIGLVHRVFHGITLRNIDKGPSHWPGTALPGETGNAVFAGHRVTHSHPFRHIDKLVPGDEVIFDIAGVRTVYLVTESFVVTPRRVDIADPTPTPTATLFACHPPGSARQRYVVRLALRA